MFRSSLSRSLRTSSCRFPPKSTNQTLSFTKASFVTATTPITPTRTPTQPKSTAAATTSRLVEKTIGSYFDEKVTEENNQWSDAVRDVKCDYRWTHKEYQKAVDGIATGLAQHYSIGSTFAVMLGFHTDTAVTFLSGAKSGVHTIFFDPSIPVPQLQEGMKRWRSSGLVFASNYGLEDHEKKIAQFCPELPYWPMEVPIRLEDFPDLREVWQIGQPQNEWVTRFSNLFTPISWPPILPKVAKKLSPQSEAFSILDNKGKRVAFSHQSILNNGIGVSQVLELNHDRLSNFVPYHTYGHSVATISCLESSSVHLIPEVNIFLEEEVLNSLEKESVSVIVSPLSYLSSLSSSSSFNTRTFKSLKKVCIVLDGEESNQVSSAQLSQIQERFKLNEVDVLVGVREGGIILHGKFNKSQNTTLSLSPLPHLSVRSSNSGLLQVQGYSVSQSYPDDGKSTNVSSDGWLTTQIKPSSSSSSSSNVVLPLH